jgi:hypothetical protein
MNQHRPIVPTKWQKMSARDKQKNQNGRTVEKREREREREREAVGGDVEEVGVIVGVGGV